MSSKERSFNGKLNLHHSLGEVGRTVHVSFECRYRKIFRGIRANVEVDCSAWTMMQHVRKCSLVTWILRRNSLGKLMPLEIEKKFCLG